MVPTLSGTTRGRVSSAAQSLLQFSEGVTGRDDELRDDGARDFMRQILARLDAEFEEHRLQTMAAVEVAVADIALGRSIDLDGLVHRLEENEQANVADVKSLERSLQIALRRIGEDRPKEIVIANELYAGSAKRLLREARLMRDARWRLMVARAEFQPSEGIGPVHGRGEPVA